MKNGKKICAIAGIVILLLMYLLTLFAAITAKPYANGLFMASAFCTVVIPILIYGFLVVYRMFHKEDPNSVTLHELRKQKRELKKQERKSKDS